MKKSVLLIIFALAVCALSFFLPQIMLSAAGDELTESVEMDPAGLTLISQGLTTFQKLEILSSDFTTSVKLDSAPDEVTELELIECVMRVVRNLFGVEHDYNSWQPLTATRELLVDSDGNSMVVWYVDVADPEFFGHFTVDADVYTGTYAVLGFEMAQFAYGTEDMVREYLSKNGIGDAPENSAALDPPADPEDWEYFSTQERFDRISTLVTTFLYTELMWDASATPVNDTMWWFYEQDTTNSAMFHVDYFVNDDYEAPFEYLGMNVVKYK